MVTPAMLKNLASTAPSMNPAMQREAFAASLSILSSHAPQIDLMTSLLSLLRKLEDANAAFAIPEGSEAARLLEEVAKAGDLARLLLRPASPASSLPAPLFLRNASSASAARSSEPNLKAASVDAAFELGPLAQALSAAPSASPLLEELGLARASTSAPASGTVSPSLRPGQQPASESGETESERALKEMSLTLGNSMWSKLVNASAFSPAQAAPSPASIPQPKAAAPAPVPAPSVPPQSAAPKPHSAPSMTVGLGAPAPLPQGAQAVPRRHTSGNGAGGNVRFNSPRNAGAKAPPPPPPPRPQSVGVVGSFPPQVPNNAQYPQYVTPMGQYVMQGNVNAGPRAPLPFHPNGPYRHAYADPSMNAALMFHPNQGYRS